jgi:hypothetical protein
MIPRFISFTALALTLLALAGVTRAEEFEGTWTIRPSDEPGQVYFGLAHHRNGGNSQSESDWPVGEFLGLDLATSERHDVKFSIARDAGRFECEGFVKAGKGAGIFHFTPSPGFAKEMAGLGFDGVDDEKQFAMAVHDVSVEFAREMKSRDLKNLDTDKLIAFRIFRITGNFIREMRAEGLTADDADTLIAFRVHGVTPAMVREVRKSGIEPTEHQLIAMKIHGVTPEFIEKVGKLGYRHPDPEQLVAMRIHGVTPEFIQNMQSRGMKDLTIDKLVNLRVHGIN